MIQLNYLKHFLGGGFIKHMQVCFLICPFSSSVRLSQVFFLIKLTLCFFIQFGYQENDFLHDVFSFTPKKIGEGKLSNEEKVCF